MVFGLCKKYCAVCGEEVSKVEAIVRFGAQLCSPEHKVVKEKAGSGGGGCCG